MFEVLLKRRKFIYGENIPVIARLFLYFVKVVKQWTKFFNCRIIKFLSKSHKVINDGKNIYTFENKNTMKMFKKYIEWWKIIQKK